MFSRATAILISLLALGFAAAAQDKPADKQKGDRDTAERTFAFTFGDDGGYLGVQAIDVNKDNISKFGLSSVRGVAIEKVIENSPAASAGLQNGDVILRFDGEEISSVRKLTRLIGEVAPDHQVKLTISRNGSEKEMTATVGKRPMPRFDNGNFTFSAPVPLGKLTLPDDAEPGELPSVAITPDTPGVTPKVFRMPGGEGKAYVWRMGDGRQIGVGVMPLTKQLAAHFGVGSGAMINNVRENSPAERAGLKAGDIIVDVDGKPIRGEIDLVRMINGKKEGDIQLTFVRDGKRQTVGITPEKSKESGFTFSTDDEDGSNAAPMPLRSSGPPAPLAPMPAKSLHFKRTL